MPNITQSEIRRQTPKDKPYDVYDDKIDGFVARVRPTGTISYMVAYDDAAGKSQNYTIGRDGKDGMNATVAREEAKDIKELIRKGRDPRSEKKQSKTEAVAKLSRTLKRYFEDRYKPKYLYGRTLKGIERSARGAAEAERALTSNFKHLFDKPLAEINTDDIEKWESDMEARGRDSETIKRIRAELESLYTHALAEKSARWAWLTTSPIAGLTPIKAKPSEDLKPRYLSEQENKRLLEALRARDTDKREQARRGNEWRATRGYELKPDLPVHYVDHLEVMVIVSLKTGLRRNELFSLEWHDIELDFSSLTVRASVAKSKKARIVPLAKPAKEALERWRDQSTSNQLVFSNAGKKFDNVNTAWIKILKDAGIKDFRWHDMRHTFASWLVIKDVSIEKVSKLLGHKDIKTTQRYAHLNNESLAQAVEVLN